MNKLSAISVDTHDHRHHGDADAGEADLCVVGAGAAGVTIALQLAGSSLRVALLEGGDATVGGAGGIHKVVFTPSPRLEIDPDRPWRFGGNTNHWRGNCRPLDPSDFEKREWIPYSGWPIDRSALLPFYLRAQQICGLADFGAYDVAACGPPLCRLADVDPDALTPKVVQTCAVRSFEELYGHRIRTAANVRLYPGVRAQRLETNPAGDTVRAVVGCDAEGRPVRIAARVVILAAGGVENPRLLLLSTDAHPNGLGNQHDLVGRFFMEHPSVDIGLEESSPACDLLFQPRCQRIGDTIVWAQLALSDALMRREHLAGLSVWAPPAAEPGDGTVTPSDVGRPDSLPWRRRWTQVPRRTWRWLARRSGVQPAAASRILRVAIEQMPDPRNQVRLSTKRDRFGLPAAELVYRVPDEDVERHARSLAAAARALGLDGKRIAQKMRRRWRDGAVNFFSHHMGTTRMHADPRHGVVDGDCRVHGVSNLFAAGSSVFPTSGTAGPTLTIIALALRLADHVRQRLPADAIERELGR